MDDRPALLAQLVRTGDAPAVRLSPPTSPLVLFDKLNMFDEPETGEDLDLEKDLDVDVDAAHVMLKASALELEVLEERSTSTDSTREEMPRILGRLTPSHKGRTPRMPSKQRLREVGSEVVAKSDRVGLEALIPW